MSYALKTDPDFQAILRDLETTRLLLKDAWVDYKKERWYPAMIKDRDSGALGFEVNFTGRWGKPEEVGRRKIDGDELFISLAEAFWPAAAGIRCKRVDNSKGDQRHIADLKFSPRLERLLGRIRSSADANPTRDRGLYRPKSGNAGSDHGLGNRLDDIILSAESKNDVEEAIQLRAIKSRRGQPRFRGDLLIAYEHRCAVSGCQVLDVLEAAHIVPHAEGTDWDITNGLLLRADIHTLLDLQLLSIASDFSVHIAPQLAGSEYEALKGTQIRLPSNPMAFPDKAKLARRHDAFLLRNP